ncbi:hypothetical protein BT69DRAFT_1351469 [Atractiella rhizophila]|nr:hypothetical protein BT69DRAFT_1351469 [Atractiella rhizophila]
MKMSRPTSSVRTGPPRLLQSSDERDHNERIVLPPIVASYPDYFVRAAYNPSQIPPYSPPKLATAVLPSEDNDSHRSSSHDSYDGDLDLEKSKKPYQGGPERTARQKSHVVSEQKRRENINRGFDDLRQLVPTSRGGSDSKASVLRKATWWIIQLQEENARLRSSRVSNNNSVHCHSSEDISTESGVCPTCFQKVDYSHEPPKSVIERAFAQYQNSIGRSKEQVARKSSTGKRLSSQSNRDEMDLRDDESEFLGIDAAVRNRAFYSGSVIIDSLQPHC